MTGDRESGVARNTLYALATQLATAAFTAALTLYLVRALGPADFGIFSLALGIAGLVMLPADFGISFSVARFIAERRGDRDAIGGLLGDATRLKLYFAGGVAVALAASGGLIASAYGEPDLAWPLRAVAAAVFGQSMMALYSQSFYAVGRLRDNFGLVLGESALEFGATVALVAGSGGAAGAATGRAIGYVGGAVLGLAIAVRVFGPGPLRLRKRADSRVADIGRYAGALMIVNGAYTLFNQIDVLLIGAILGSAAVGVFSAPVRLTTLLHYPGLAISNSVAPRVARGENNEPDVASFRTALRILVVVQAAQLAPVIVWAEPIVSLLLGPEYRESAGVLRAMSAFVFLQGIAPLVSVSVNYLGEARRRIPIAIAALLVNFAIDIAFLDDIGVIAGGIGTSVAYLLYTGGHLAICRRLLGFSLRALGLTFARSMAAAAAMAGVLALFGTHELSVAGWLLGGTGGVIAFVAVLLVTRELSWAEVSSVVTQRLHRSSR